MTVRATLCGVAIAGVIDTTTEVTFPLAAAARRYPSTRRDRCLHPATLHRWRCRGVNGVRLECVRVGGVWHTSAQALQRFFERLTTAESLPALPASVTEKRAARSKPVGRPEHHAQIETQLDTLLAGKPVGGRRATEA